MTRRHIAGTVRTWFAGAVACSLLVTVLLMIFRTDIVRFESADANAFSRSYLGHRAFAELLSRCGIPVVVSTSSSGRKCGKSSVLVAAEPRFTRENSMDARRFKWMLGEALTRLVVFPKWNGEADELHPARLRTVTPVHDSVNATLWKLLDCKGTIVRAALPETFAWSGLPDGVRLYCAAPQLIVSESVEPIVSCDEGILFGKIAGKPGGGEIYLLSDPDLIANFNIGNDDNALFALMIAEHVRGGGAVVIDETAHGFELHRSLLRSFFEFPLVTVLISMLLSAVLLVWFASVRFGLPLATKPPVQKGRGALVGTSASLLLRGRHYDFLIERFYHQTVAAVISALPGTYPVHDVTGYLDIIGMRRGVTHTLESITIRMDAFRNTKKKAVDEMLDIAGHLHDWKKEMLYGFQ